MGSLKEVKAEDGAAPSSNGAAAAPTATAGPDNPTRRGRSASAAVLPLEVGTRVMCRWRDQKPHPVKVIERRKTSSGGPNDYEYYVHYTECKRLAPPSFASMCVLSSRVELGFDVEIRVSASLFVLTVNRRLDEWVKLEQLDLDTVETDVDEKVEDKVFFQLVTSLKMTRHQKRKIDETHVEHGHEELDAASLREHEEFTKVKNIAKIELGRYEIDTWYFSPFPPEYSDSPKLYFCEFCLNFMKRKEQLQRHMRKCDLKHPPGDEIYRSGTLSMFEVNFIYFSIYRQELSDMTAIKPDDILSTLQTLDLIQYRKGQHVICADPKVLDRHLKAAGRGGLEVDVSKLIWTPYKEQG
ncbi:hypothetical protein B296_00006745 [Ensete ventricosum]|uniref:Histone acetyltransferase n=1 Tax=Ensete ventricosum TaxID=4639 RepID=A0A427AB90_ENSVE|nr:hypothetical protein B296_00006745 [Ensete ventricosum]